MESKDQIIPGQPQPVYPTAPPPTYTAVSQPPVPQTTFLVRDTGQPMPENNMIFACVVIWLCPSSCICGLVAFICSTRVKSLYDSGDYQGAESASKQAKIWSIVGLVLGILNIVIGGVGTVILIVTAAAAVGASAGLVEGLTDELTENLNEYSWWG